MLTGLAFSGTFLITGESVAPMAQATTSLVVPEKIEEKEWVSAHAETPFDFVHEIPKFKK